MSAAARNPFSATYRYLQRQAHENTAVFWSIILGAIGPVAVVVVPPIRKSMGWQPSERIPNTFPIPQRAREEITGYDDE